MRKQGWENIDENDEVMLILLPGSSTAQQAPPMIIALAAALPQTRAAWVALTRDHKNKVAQWWSRVATAAV